MTRIHSGLYTKALVVEHPDAVLDELLRADGLQVDRATEVPDEAGLIRMLRDGGHQVLFKRSRVPVTRAVLEACPQLHAVQLCCIGDDSVDKRACADHGVLVFNDPFSNGRSVVELAVAHLIALARRLYETNEHTRAGGFDKSQVERFEIQGRVLGILGLGNIGRQVARAAEALGMKVVFHDTREVAREIGVEMGWEEVATIDALFRRSDCVTVHVSAEDARGNSNRGLLTYEHFSQLAADRPGVSPRIFLNLARGFLYDPEDLLRAIDEGNVGRAAVDVYPEEPRGSAPWTNPYARQPRVATTPHLGAATVDAQPRIARRVAQTFRSYNRYGALRDCVYRPRLLLGLGEIAPGSTLLAVVHSTRRGSRKALQDAIFEAGASNLSTVHQDFEDYGMAFDLSAIDRPLDEDQLRYVLSHAADLTGEAGSIRSIRQVTLA
ncbi:MAG: NAD(P)-dependent oxidoreductase [Pseudomonadota bacterium]|nr:NAD(P)-dependent oxidoreductase [Pseudomonadota bacterium]